MEKEELKKLWAIIEELEKNHSGEMVNLQNELIDLLLKYLPFKNKQEKNKYIDLLLSFKFWEDIEEETKRIINNKE